MIRLRKAGLYRGRVVRHECGTTRRGVPQITIAFELLKGQGCGTVRNVYLYVTPRAERHTREALQELGFHGDPQSLWSVSGRQLSLVGRECYLVCRHEKYEEHWQEKWSIVVARSDLVVSRIGPSPAQRTR